MTKNPRFFLSVPNSVIVLTQRAWLAGSGVITVLVIIYSLTSAEQGWYYTFQSFAAISILFDFGLSAIIVQMTVKESMGLTFAPNGELVGNSVLRMIGFVKGVQRWYNYSAVACWLLLPVGMLILYQRTALVNSSWIWPWGLLILFTSVNQIVVPWPFILEGLGRVRESYLLRLGQGIFGSVLLWAALLSGLGIYAVAMRPQAMSNIASGWWLAHSRSRLPSQIKSGTTATYAWKKQIGKLHKKTAVSWIAGYVLMHLYVPILFSVSGPTAAGQLGLSMTIANTLVLLSQSWITSSFPLLSQSAASMDWMHMDHIFLKPFRLGVTLYLLGAGTFLLACYALEGTHYGSRLLPIPELSVLLIAFFATHIASMLETQVRAYRRDPFALNSAVCAFITLAAVFPAVQAFGLIGVVTLSAFVSIAVRLPWSAYLFRRSNQQWRHIEIHQ
jgi:hypothetical protein